MLTLQEVRLLHAKHFSDLLSRINSLYKDGNTIADSLALFETERANCELAQATLRLFRDKDLEARILCSRFSRQAASILNLTLHVQQRMQWLEDGIQAARLLGAERLEARHLIDLGACYAVIGNQDKSREYQERAVAICKAIGDLEGEASATGNLANHYLRTNDPQRAIALLQEALAIFLILGKQRSEADAFNSLGVAYKDIDRLDDALEHHERALRLAQEIGYLRCAGIALTNLGVVFKKKGNLADALQAYENALKILRSIRDIRSESNAQWNMALIYHRLGHTERAVSCAKSALELRHRAGDPRTGKIQERLVQWEAEQH